MSPWEKLLEHPDSRSHLLQLYDADEAGLARNVCRYLFEGLRRGDGAMVIVAPAHRELFSAVLGDLGAGVPALLESRQMVFCDAGDTLAKFMEAGRPVWHRFDTAIREAMRQVRPHAVTGGLRAFGEMVGILWKERQFAAAIRLEQFWNRLLEQSSFCLYCAYHVDIFGKEVSLANLDSVLCAHTHLMPAQSDGRLDEALDRSMDEVLGPEAQRLRLQIQSSYLPERAITPSAESTVLWLRKNLPDQADSILHRARHHLYRLSEDSI